MAVRKDENVQALVDKISNLPAFDPSNAREFHSNYEEEGLCVSIQANCSREAAIKMGLMFVELNALRNVSEDSSKNRSRKVVITDSKLQLKELYEVLIVSGEVFVELAQILEREEAGETRFDQNDEEATEMDTLRPSCDLLPSTSLQFGEDLLESALKKYFGHESFRPLQKETIEATLAGKSVLTVVGTGGGKTLMFLLPGILSDKLSLVVSPIKSLIDDTLLRCHNLDISVCKFTGDVPIELQERQVENIQQYKVILATPEMLQEGMLLSQAIAGLDLGRIVFDEAHTIATWGSTFRPVFKTVCLNLAKLSCPKLLLSATVTAKLQQTLLDIFGRFLVFRETVYRENLTFEVADRSPKHIDEIASFVREKCTVGHCGIIYCVIPHDVDKMHSELLKRGLNAVKYHGQLSDEVKQANFSKWLNGEVCIMVANSSFGMGIDKSDVR
jgi:superfamily II DNA helicase RecQ